MAYIPRNLTASATVDASFAGAVTTINAAAGLTVTLPASSGSGYQYDFFIGTTVTSNSVIIKVANSTDIMVGLCIMAQDAGNTNLVFEALNADGFDTITMNGTTTAGIRGDRITLTDVASGFWSVQMWSSGTGTEAQVFSATV